MSETARKPQAQDRQPGREQEMEPRPQAEMRNYRGAGKLDGKIALISGGDSGIGRAVAIGFAKEGADVAITYLDEHEDAQETVRLIEAEGRRAMAVPGISATRISRGNWCVKWWRHSGGSTSWSIMRPSSIRWSNWRN